MTARGRLVGCSLAPLLLGLGALSACGSDAETHTQRVAFCQGAPSDNSVDGMLVVEWRQGGTVLATASGAVGTVLSAEVPLGGIQAYVDDVYVGSANEGVSTEGPWTAPGPRTYLATDEEGCPSDPFL